MTNRTAKYQGFTIEVADDFQFRIVEEPLADNHIRYSSLREAKEVIDQHRSKTLVQRRKEAVLALPVVTGDGTVTKIKGIHASQGHILTEDKKEHRDIYVDRPVIRAAVKEKQRLLALLDPVNQTLVKASINARRLYGRSASTEKYVNGIEALEEEYRETAAILDSGETH